MAAMQRRLVHKQFNSPINLYSQKNVQETLDRELKLLSNGAVGIDFDDPSTTKPPSLAKSAVLAALEEEEREKSRGTGRQSRSRQPAPRLMMTPSTPCIDRETVLKINRRPLQRRHRSCDNVWPPRPLSTEGQHHRHPSPTERGPVGEVMMLGQQRSDAGLDYAIWGGRRYGSHDSVYFDERIRRQHKIDPLRTLFDKENVVFTDWGHRPTSAPGNALEGRAGDDKNGNHVYVDYRPLGGRTNDPDQDGTQGKSFQDDCLPEVFDERLGHLKPTTPNMGRMDITFRAHDLDEQVNQCTDADEMRAGKCNHHYNHHRKEPHPPAPPPRRYYLPMDKIVSGELEVTVRLFQDTPIAAGQHRQTLERRSATPSYDRPSSDERLHERSKSVQGQALASRERCNPAANNSLLQDGIESKPPLKLKSGRSTPRPGGPSPVGMPGGVSVTLQRHPTVTDVSSIEEASVNECFEASYCLTAFEEATFGAKLGEASISDAPEDTPTTDDEFNINSNTVLNLNIDARCDTPTSEAAAVQLHQKPPKRGRTYGGPTSPPGAVNSTPSALATLPPAAVSVGGAADQLPTTNYFDKQLHRQPGAGVGLSHRARFPQTELEGFGFPLRGPDRPSETPPADDDGIDRDDHKFDSSAQLTRTLTSEEIHNYNEKLITDTSDARAMTAATGAGGGRPAFSALPPPPPQPHSSALNVANQPNRNWINLNSNQIYHQQRSGAVRRDPEVTSPWDRSCQRVGGSPARGGPFGTVEKIVDACPTTSDHGDRQPTGTEPGSNTTPETGRTHVAYSDCDPGTNQAERRKCASRESARPQRITDTTATENANDNLQRQCRRGADQPRTDYNYDNKSVRSHYRAGASPALAVDNGRLPDDAPQRYVTPSPPPPPFPEPPLGPERWPRARSGSSGSSVKINEIFEFPPPPPYPCDCGAAEAELALGEDEQEKTGQQEPRCPQWRTNVNEFELDRMRADGDTGRDYATSEQTDRPRASSSAASAAAAALTTSCPRNRTVRATFSQPSDASVPSAGEFPGGDNDVTTTAASRGHDDPRPRGPLQTAPPSVESAQHIFHPTDPRIASFGGQLVRPGAPSTGPGSSVNVDVDYFRTNFTVDKISNTNANTVRNLGEEQNKYHAIGSVDKSIDAERRGQRYGAENRTNPPTGASDADANAPVRHVQLPDTSRVRRMISFTDGEFIFGPIDERALEFERFELLGDKLAPRTVDGEACTWPMTAYDAGDRQPDDPEAGQEDSRERLASSGTPRRDAAEIVATMAADFPPQPTADSGSGATGETKLTSDSLVAVGEAKGTGVENYEDDKPNIVANEFADIRHDRRLVSRRSSSSPAPAAAPTPPVPRPVGADPGYGRWARFENGNISPPLALGNNAPEPGDGGRPAKRLTRGDEIEEIFQQLNHSLKANVTKDASGGSDGKSNDAAPTASYRVAIGQLVENVPLIDSILDDLLTFSKQLLRKQEQAQERARLATVAVADDNESATQPGVAAAADGPVVQNRETAQLTEINDDNLINLLADGTDAREEDVDDRRDADVDKSRNNEREPNDNGTTANGREHNEKAKKPANNDQHSNHLHHYAQPAASEDENWQAAVPREDLFTNVAIFNWNPLDVYQQHGLFMIDPRFALADMRAESPALPTASMPPPVKPLATVLEESETSTDTVNDNNDGDDDTGRPHQQPCASINSRRSSNSEKRASGTAGQEGDTINNSAFTPEGNVKFPLSQLPQLHDKNFPAMASPWANSSVAAFNRNTNTCHNPCWPLSVDPSTTTNNDGWPVGEHDPRDKIVQMNQALHFYDACHVRYPLGELGGSSGTPEPDGVPTPISAPTEGLKRVAWPPPVEGPEYEVHPSQQQHAVGQQIPVQQQQQQQQYQPSQHQQPQQFYHQPVPQQQKQPHPTYQQTNFQQQQQQQHPHQPVERIIPIQRATSIQSPLATPTKSPVHQPKYPAYPVAGPVASPGSPYYAAGPSPTNRGSSTVAFSGDRAVQPNKPPHYQQPQQQQQPFFGGGQQQRGGYGSPAPRSPGIPVASPRSPGSTLSASPRGWHHVASPVPVQRPSPQPSLSSSSSPFYHQQHQQPPQQYHQQGYVPSVQTGSAPPAAWYGARKPEDQHQHQQQPLAPQYQNPPQQQSYQPQPTEAFQPLTAQQPLYQPTVQPQQQQQQQLPPTLVTTLRKEPPMSQEPAPVYQTQPVAAIYQGGSNMRGDQKWPPEEYKRQSEVDNEERLKLAQQPAFRPRRQQKDYGAFFAKNALNSTYPGYRAPPGTQHHG